MNDQKQLWNNVYAQEKIEYSSKPNDFCLEVLNLIKPNAKILELGCGTGNDSVGFSKAGHTIMATDISEVVIDNDAKQFRNYTNITFKILDMNNPFNFNENEFDVVYARLSLHYFRDIVTRKIFDEIFRILKPNGLLCFICKSIGDPLYGKGKKVEEDMYEFNKHVRHFFGEGYTHSLLESRFRIEKMESGNDIFYKRDSAFIKVFARAIK